MSKKVIVDLEAIQSGRPSTVHHIHLPQTKDEPHSNQSATKPRHIQSHPISQLFNRPQMFDMNMYSQFKEDVIDQPTYGQTIIGWIILIVTIPLMSLGLLAYWKVEGGVLGVALNISLAFAIINHIHGLLSKFVFRNSANDEDQKVKIYSLLQAGGLKLIRVLLTAFLVRNVQLSYVSLELGYSSHITLFILMMRSDFHQYKMVFAIVVAAAIPISLHFNLLYTILGIIMTGVYLRLEIIKQKPLESSVSWFICVCVLFIITVLFFPASFIFDWSFAIVFIFVLLSSKLGKQYLLNLARRCYMNEEIIKCSIKLIPFVFFFVFQKDFMFGIFLLIGVAGTILSEYKTELEDDQERIVFT